MSDDERAILAANATVGTDTIHFDIAGAGPHVISVGSALPSITDAIVLDATSEPDYAGAPVVRVDGSAAGDIDGLALGAGSGATTLASVMSSPGRG